MPSALIQPPPRSPRRRTRAAAPARAGGAFEAAALEPAGGDRLAAGGAAVAEGEQRLADVGERDRGAADLDSADLADRRLRRVERQPAGGPDLREAPPAPRPAALSL